MKVRLVPFGGTNQIEVDGKIIDSLAFKTFRPETVNIDDFYAAGVRIFNILSSGRDTAFGVPYSLYGESWLGDGVYDFGPIDRQVDFFIEHAPNPSDGRDLVKELASIFKTRIEMRQIGVRDETKILGGMGICGRPLCCHSYLTDFVPVSIKMAKEQNLSLNPSKISGVCGRLMCCLNNEEEVYEEQNRKLPSAGDYVTTSLGERGIVQSVNIFRETIRVLVQNGDEKEMKEYRADEIRFKKRRKKGRLELTPEELEQLKSLEPEEIAELTAEIREEEPEDAEADSVILAEMTDHRSAESRDSVKPAGNYNHNSRSGNNNRYNGSDTDKPDRSGGRKNHRNNRNRRRNNNRNFGRGEDNA